MAKYREQGRMSMMLSLSVELEQDCCVCCGRGTGGAKGALGVLVASLQNEVTLYTSYFPTTVQHLST